MKISNTTASISEVSTVTIYCICKWQIWVPLLQACMVTGLCLFVCFCLSLIPFFQHVSHLSEKAMAPHSSTLAWKIQCAEEPGGLQSMGSLRVRRDWATSFSLFTLCIGEGNGNPLQCSCLENPRDGVAQSQTRLNRLSSSSSSHLCFIKLQYK